MSSNSERFMFGHLEDAIEAPSTSSTATSSPPRLSEEESAMASGLEAEGETESVLRIRQTVQRAWSSLEGKGKNLRALAFILAFKYGYVARIRSSLCYSVASSNKKFLAQHSFIVISSPGHQQITVDPSFRDQFQIGMCDHEYSSFLDSEVPEVFVGTRTVMSFMIHFICKMMHAALTRLHLGIPPWRQVDVIISKWKPASYRDEHFGPYETQSVRAAAALQISSARISYGGSQVLNKDPNSRSVATRGFPHQSNHPPEPTTKVMGFNIPDRRTLAASPQPPSQSSSPPASPKFVGWPHTTLPRSSTCSSGPTFLVRSLSDRACHAAGEQHRTPGC